MPDQTGNLIMSSTYSMPLPPFGLVKFGGKPVIKHRQDEKENLIDTNTREL